MPERLRRLTTVFKQQQRPEGCGCRMPETAKLGEICEIEILTRHNYLKKDDDSKSCHGNIYLDSTGQTFDYKAYFIDLDLKPLDRMEHYSELDQKIVNNYNQMGGAENGNIQPDRCDWVEVEGYEGHPSSYVQLQE